MYRITATCQFNTQIYYLDQPKIDEVKTPALWCSDPLPDWTLSEDKCSLNSEKCSIALSEDGTTYTIKSTTNLKAVVNLTFKRTASGFVVGNDGTTLYGHDATAPWGSMRHSFWPTCEVKGSIMTQGGEIKMDGRGVYIHALQGMKPHHCGKSACQQILFHSSNQ
jgi:Svf1-like N-terminal lipocalin domain